MQQTQSISKACLQSTASKRKERENVEKYLWLKEDCHFLLTCNEQVNRNKTNRVREKKRELDRERDLTLMLKCHDSMGSETSS